MRSMSLSLVGWAVFAAIALLAVAFPANPRRRVTSDLDRERPWRRGAPD